MHWTAALFYSRVYCQEKNLKLLPQAQVRMKIIDMKGVYAENTIAKEVNYWCTKERGCSTTHGIKHSIILPIRLKWCRSFWPGHNRDASPNLPVRLGRRRS